jgi:hypothetical protein
MEINKSQIDKKEKKIKYNLWILIVFFMIISMFISISVCILLNKCLLIFFKFI